MEQRKGFEIVKDLGRTLMITVPVWSATFMSVAFCLRATGTTHFTVYFLICTPVSSTITVLFRQRTLERLWLYLILGNAAWYFSFMLVEALYERVYGGSVGPVQLLLWNLGISPQYEWEVTMLFDWIVPTAFVGTLLYWGAKQWFAIRES